MLQIIFFFFFSNQEINASCLLEKKKSLQRRIKIFYEEAVGLNSFSPGNNVIYIPCRQKIEWHTGLQLID